MDVAHDLQIPVPDGVIRGDLALPLDARAVVVFAHGSGSSRFSPRNREVASALNHRGLATLLVDLLTTAEDEVDRQTREYRFDIPRLAERLMCAVDWLGEHRATADLAVGLFGASTGAAAALVTAAHRPTNVGAVVSRGGRADLAGDDLDAVRAPTLLVVGGRDTAVIDMNERAAHHLVPAHRISIIDGAGHLFEEPGALEDVATQAADWFVEHLVEVSTEH